MMQLIRRNWKYCRKCMTLKEKIFLPRLSSSVAGSGGPGSTSKPASSADEDDNEGEGKWPRRVVSGLQPTGALHVGNYYGAVQRCVDFQEKGEDLILFIADLHALTTPRPSQRLRDDTLELTATLLASGVDPNRTVLFRQSAVPRHAELCWALTCVGTQARLAQLPQYRERVAAAGGKAELGSLLYPVLQAADVLLYRGTHVPVGADQLQHLQLASQLAKSFRHRYGEAFPFPKPLLPDDPAAARLRSLRDPAKKMSKSDPDSKSRILLTDSDEQIALKIRKAVTDFTPEITYCQETRPGVSNLVTLHCLARSLVIEEALLEAEGLNTVQYKKLVSTALCEVLGPVRDRIHRLRARPEYLEDVLRHGASRARKLADETYQCVAELMGVAPAPLAQPELLRRAKKK